MCKSDITAGYRTGKSVTGNLSRVMRMVHSGTSKGRLKVALMKGPKADDVLGGGSDHLEIWLNKSMKPEDYMIRTIEGSHTTYDIGELQSLLQHLQEKSRAIESATVNRVLVR